MNNENSPSLNPKTTLTRILLTSAILLIIGYYLVSAWITIVEEHDVVQWQHVTAVLFFLPLPILLFKNYKAAVIGTGIYLLIGVLKGLSFTAGLETDTITIAGLTTPAFNMSALELLILFAILHIVVLINMYLDYKENKAKRKSR
jgi:hypothetical protein